MSPGSGDFQVPAIWGLGSPHSRVMRLGAVALLWHTGALRLFWSVGGLTPLFFQIKRSAEFCKFLNVTN